MPQIASLAEFNRNQTKMLEQLATTKRPIYLTRNGANAVVVMDSEAFEKFSFNQENAKLEEMRVYEGIMRGMSDYVTGKTFSKEELKRRISEKSFEE